MKRITVYELAELASEMLDFTDGNIERSIEAVIIRFRNYLVVRSGVQKWTVQNDGENDEFLRAQILEVPEARNKFSRVVAERVEAGRESNERYPELAAEYAELMARVKEIEEEILAIDNEHALRDVPLKDLIEWDAEIVCPASFTSYHILDPNDKGE